ncbi:Deoxyribonuclease I protein [Dioscorea alata]|uniref:Deoxyribonuclease I protein n=1 Tax=Dioscorea alata TaxID=55571 RepID=A0ACB7VKX6_DIOAL|nr:Deoxyribonuclease I protein [Dioscorea alata]
MLRMLIILRLLQMIEIYSLRAVAKKLAGRPDGWNREHLWPRSYGLIDAPALSDLHNIRPADVNVNSSRGNKYYGECTDTSTDCLRPANREAALDTETDKQRWAPPLQVRGDIARSLMYMAVCYGFHVPDRNPPLQLSDSPNVQNRTMGLLSELLKWNEIDPPSREEQLRNERICKLYQHNRNPFIDHPEYANLIWKPTIPTISTTFSPSLQAWVNEFHYNNKGEDRNEFVEVIVKRSTDASTLKLILYNGADGKMYASLPLEDGQVFTINNSNSGFLIFTTFVRLQNGPADGIALVSGRNDDHYEVIQFLSYGGTLKAKDGPAKGIESIDLQLQETKKSSDDDSLGLTGQSLRELHWRKFVRGATPGKLNIGQRIEDTMIHSKIIPH